MELDELVSNWFLTIDFRLDDGEIKREAAEFMAEELRQHGRCRWNYGLILQVMQRENYDRFHEDHRELVHVEPSEIEE